MMPTNDRKDLHFAYRVNERFQVLTKLNTRYKISFCEWHILLVGSIH